MRGDFRGRRQQLTAVSNGRPLILFARIGRLDPDEAEALLLVASLDVETPILLDDQQARRVAQVSRLYVIGSGGILGRAKEAELISTVRPLLRELTTAGLYLGDTVVSELLATAGEEP